MGFLRAVLDKMFTFVEEFNLYGFSTGAINSSPEISESVANGVDPFAPAIHITIALWN